MAAAWRAREVAPEETALLVLQFLQRGFPESATTFAREAAPLLRRVAEPSAPTKTLAQILSEYLALSADARRRSLFEHGFGDVPLARQCLTSLVRVLEDYERATSNSRGKASCSTSSGTSGRPGAAGAVGASAAVELHGARRRKSSQPRRIGGGDSALARSLFGARAHGGGSALGAQRIAAHINARAAGGAYSSTTGAGGAGPSARMDLDDIVEALLDETQEYAIPSAMFTEAVQSEGGEAARAAKAPRRE